MVKPRIESCSSVLWRGLITSKLFCVLNGLFNKDSEWTSKRAAPWSAYWGPIFAECCKTWTHVVCWHAMTHSLDVGHWLRQHRGGKWESTPVIRQTWRDRSCFVKLHRDLLEAWFQFRKESKESINPMRFIKIVRCAALKAWQNFSTADKL